MEITNKRETIPTGGAYRLAVNEKQQHLKMHAMGTDIVWKVKERLSGKGDLSQRDK